jgi:hypothetical protein
MIDRLRSPRSMAGDVGHARFDAAAILHLVAADDFNLHERRTDLFDDAPPFVARERPAIHAVCDNSLASTQVATAWATAYPSASTGNPACRSACSMEIDPEVTAAIAHANSRAMIVLATPAAR